MMFEKETEMLMSEIFIQILENDVSDINYIRRFKYNIILDYRFKECVCHTTIKVGSFEYKTALIYNYDNILKLNKKDKEELWRILQNLYNYDNLQEKMR